MMPFLKLTPSACRRMWLRHRMDRAAEQWILLWVLLCLGSTLPPPLPVAPRPSTSAVMLRQKLAKLKSAKAPRQTPSLNKPMAKTVSVISHAQPMQPLVPSTVTASWNPVDGATGYLLCLYLEDGTPWRTLNVKIGVSVTITVPGGFKYLAYVRAYTTLYGHTLYSDGALTLSTTATLQPNTVQFLTVGSQWRVCAVATTNVWFASSTNLAGSNWTKLGAVSNVPALFNGTMTGNQFFGLVR